MAKKKKKKTPLQQPQSKAIPAVPGLESILKSRYYVLYYAVFIFVLTVILFNEFIFSNKMLFSSDFINASCYFREFWKEHLDFPFGIPLWSPMIFGGMPFVDAFHSDIFYPITYPIKLALSIPRAFGWSMLIHVFLAGLFMYACARTFKMSRLAASFAGIFYMFAPYLVSMVQPGHDGKMFVTALFPLAMLFLERAMNDHKFLDFTLLGAVIGLIVLTPHPQMSYFMLWAVGFYFGFRIIFKLIERRNIVPIIRPGLLFVMAIVLGLFISAIQFYPSYRYVKEYSPRAIEEEETEMTEAQRYAYATSWSMNSGELVSQFIPNFIGTNAKKFTATGEAQHTYWGQNVFKDNSEYIGILPIFLGLIAIIFVRNKRTWFFMGLALFALIYAMGGSTPLYRIFYHLIPNVKHLRAASMIMFIFSFSFCLLAGFGIDYLREALPKLKDAVKRKVFLFSGIAAGLYGFLAVAFSLAGKSIMKAFASISPPYTPQGVSIDTILEYRAFPNLGDIVIGLWILAAVFVLTYIIIKAYGNRTIGLWALGIIVFFGIVDAWRIDFKFITTTSPEQYFATNNVVSMMRDTDKPYVDRLLDADRGVLRNSNYFAYHDIPMMFGYHGNQMKIYDQYWFRQGKSNDHSFIYRIENDPQQGNRGNMVWLNTPFIGMAGVKYLVTDYMTDLGVYRDSLTQISQNSDLQADGLILYQFPDNFKRVRLYHDYVLSEDYGHGVDYLRLVYYDYVLREARGEVVNYLRMLYDEYILHGELENELNYLRTLQHDWTRQVVLEKDPGFAADSAAVTEGEYAEIASYDTDEVVINVKSNTDGIVYFAGCYYPAWKAYVNGEEAEVLLANAAFRGVVVPEGEHEVVFRYESEVYNNSRAVTLASSAFVVLVLAFSLFRCRRVEEKAVE
ncbi:MAG TPA: hypothetical protein ENO22_00585 [candidate division Zixibacteria bacterium]|nr:hypothetical protein [candidate division Zixibacteria bacterium]